MFAPHMRLAYFLIRSIAATKNRELTKESVMLPDKQKKAYEDFYDSARKNDILEPKMTLMLHLAAAMAVGCHP
jgi:hypothetical protein